MVKQSYLYRIISYVNVYVKKKRENVKIDNNTEFETAAAKKRKEKEKGGEC